MTTADDVFVIILIVRHMVFTPDGTPFNWARRGEDRGSEGIIPARDDISFSILPNNPPPSSVAATGDIFGSMRCDCCDQLEASLQLIDKAGEGLLIYLRGHEGRGIGLGNKVRAYALQEQGMDTMDANIQLGFASDVRNYGAAVEMLRHFRLSEVRILTNTRTHCS